MPDGRFAPSPTGSLHVGNLRTALLAWLFARADGGRFLIRVDDLDPVASREEFVAEQLADVQALGLDHDGPVIRQSAPAVRAGHERALDRLDRAGLLYPCWCSRREVAEAASAAHGPLPEGTYPGICRDLTDAEREARAAELPDRPPAQRVRGGEAVVTVRDRLHGEVTAVVDDFVVRRRDGVPAYNLAVVVDDDAQGVDEVVRGDDLLDGTARQAWMCGVLDVDVPSYAHVPLVLGPDNERLSKRHRSTTLAELAADGVDATEVLSMMAVSLDLASPGEAVTSELLLRRFDPEAVPLAPWVFAP